VSEAKTYTTSDGCPVPEMPTLESMLAFAKKFDEERRRHIAEFIASLYKGKQPDWADLIDEITFRGSEFIELGKLSAFPEPIPSSHFSQRRFRLVVVCHPNEAANLSRLSRGPAA